MSLRVERDGAIASLILDRPDARNALSPPMGDAVRAAVAELGADPAVRVVLVRGAGKVFSAGGDFDFIEARQRDSAEGNRAAMLDFYHRFLSIRQLRVPTIAVVHGAAIGAGMCFALACDIRLSGAGAKLGFNFVRLGLHPGMGATWLLPRVVGPAAASELLLSGRIISAEEALRIGLVSAVHAEDQLLEAARALAAEIASAAPLAVSRTRATLAHGTDQELQAALEREAAAQALDYATADLAEGVRAFREKRSPRFEGR